MNVLYDCRLAHYQPAVPPPPLVLSTTCPVYPSAVTIPTDFERLASSIQTLIEIPDLLGNRYRKGVNGYIRVAEGAMGKQSGRRRHRRRLLDHSHRAGGWDV